MFPEDTFYLHGDIDCTDDKKFRWAAGYGGIQVFNGRMGGARAIAGSDRLFHGPTPFDVTPACMLRGIGLRQRLGFESSYTDSAQCSRPDKAVI
jgi:hypothetical protein